MAGDKIVFLFSPVVFHLARWCSMLCREHHRLRGLGEQPLTAMVYNHKAVNAVALTGDRLPCRRPSIPGSSAGAPLVPSRFAVWHCPFFAKWRSLPGSNGEIFGAKG